MSRPSKPAWVREALAYAALAALCLVITNVYALFGHGVRSDAMDTMFAYPLLLGALGVLSGLWLGPARARGLGRLGRNLYNSGIAALTAGALLRGILEIAGTASAFTVGFLAVGWALAGVGAVAMAAAGVRAGRQG